MQRRREFTQFYRAPLIGLALSATNCFKHAVPDQNAVNATANSCRLRTLRKGVPALAELCFLNGATQAD